MSELLLGCGSNRDKKLSAQGRAAWSGLVTLDINADHAPDVVHDLNVLPLPFADEQFEEIHAEVQATSPNFDNIARAIRIDAKLEVGKA